MDESFSSQFVQAIANKLKKRSYLPFLEKYAKGYLLVQSITRGSMEARFSK